LRGLRADAVDIAAHAELDPGDPLASALMLAPAGAASGRLELREVFGMSSLPPLLTLSACSSAGSDVRGDEWVGLGYGFLAAGSRSVIAIQDRVSDLAAALVVKRFYRALGQGSLAESLRQAALWTRRTYAHPAHWATFVLMGDYR
jgi:CHAT domain-containing protein